MDENTKYINNKQQQFKEDAEVLMMQLVDLIDNNIRWIGEDKEDKLKTHLTSLYEEVFKAV